MKTSQKLSQEFVQQTHFAIACYARCDPLFDDAKTHLTGAVRKMLQRPLEFKKHSKDDRTIAYLIMDACSHLNDRELNLEVNAFFENVIEKAARQELDLEDLYCFMDIADRGFCKVETLLPLLKKRL